MYYYLFISVEYCIVKQMAVAFGFYSQCLSLKEKKKRYLQWETEGKPEKSENTFKHSTLSQYKQSIPFI